ncbi:hypothetical protein [Methylobacterium dankookense]|uniref:hypothetical protein n=2 Tax=Methylobacterium dankookense TaxID=560405 RepID=UPI00119EA945|nr:hypothetical protein [Methylobacterium dankookense]
MFSVGDERQIPLCVHCYSKFSEVINLEFLKSVLMMNQAAAEMDLVAPFGPPTPKVPVGEFAKAMQKGHTFNNFNVNNSQIGVINTGELAKIDAAITLSRGSDAEIFGQKVQILTEALLKSTEVSQAQKNEIIDLIQALTSEVIAKRKPAVIGALLQSIGAKVSGISVLARLTNDLIGLAKDLF